MPDKPINPLRQRLIDTMTARRYSEKAQQAYVRQVRTRPVAGRRDER
jgi:hypothetical protein